MIKWIAVDHILLEDATTHHLGLIRISFDRVRTSSEQYDLCKKARLWYGDRKEVMQMEDDLKYSEKPKF